MGSRLAAGGKQAPTLLAWAACDPDSASLQRLQIIKDWRVDGRYFEQVYDMPCADDDVVDPTTQRCPDNGATEGSSSCEINAGLGAGKLKASWQDPGFDPSHRAFYMCVD